MNLFQQVWFSETVVLTTWNLQQFFSTPIASSTPDPRLKPGSVKFKPNEFGWFILQMNLFQQVWFCKIVVLTTGHLQQFFSTPIASSTPDPKLKPGSVKFKPNEFGWLILQMNLFQQVWFWETVVLTTGHLQQYFFHTNRIIHTRPQIETWGLSNSNRGFGWFILQMNLFQQVWFWETVVLTTGHLQQKFFHTNRIIHTRPQIETWVCIIQTKWIRLIYSSNEPVSYSSNEPVSTGLDLQDCGFNHRAFTAEILPHQSHHSHQTPNWNLGLSNSNRWFGWFILQMNLFQQVWICKPVVLTTGSETIPPYCQPEYTVFFVFRNLSK